MTLVDQLQGESARREFWIGKVHHALDDMENARGLGARFSAELWRETSFPEDLREIPYYNLLQPYTLYTTLLCIMYPSIMWNQVVFLWRCLSIVNTYIWNSVNTTLSIKGRVKISSRMVWIVWSQVKITLTTFFKKLCPRASHLHLRMFHNWLKDSC